MLAKVRCSLDHGFHRSSSNGIVEPTPFPKSIFFLFLKPCLRYTWDDVGKCDRKGAGFPLLGCLLLFSPF